MRLAALALGAALLVGAQADDSPEALVQRTKSTNVTYAAYSWVYGRNQEGERNDSWAAELHSGDWHRAEGRTIRTLANCRTHQGWVYDIASSALSANDQVWIGACGIFTGNQIVAVDRLPGMDGGKYGRLDVVRVTDRSFVRFYAIDARAVIIRGNWTAANGSPAPCSQSEAIAILPNLPGGALFTTESLSRSAVPDRYKVAPSGPAPRSLSGKRCG